MEILFEALSSGETIKKRIILLFNAIMLEAYKKRYENIFMSPRNIYLISDRKTKKFHDPTFFRCRSQTIIVLLYGGIGY